MPSSSLSRIALNGHGQPGSRSVALLRGYDASGADCGFRGFSFGTWWLGSFFSGFSRPVLEA